MSSFIYNRNIPDGPNDPSNDQPDMKENTNSIDDWTKVTQDHYGFNVPFGGYHRYIHQPPQTTPGNISGIGQTYTKTVGSDVQLFYESGTGVETQLTGPNAASATTNGYTWLPGGILLQWGRKTPIVSGGTVIVTYPIPFPNAIFSVVASPRTSTSIGGGTHDWDIGGVGTTTFNITANGNYVNSDSFYWTAIGN